MLNLPIQALPKLLKYGSVTSDMLTTDMVVDIADALGQKLSASDVDLAAITAAMRESDLSTLSDVLGRPDVFPKIVSLFSPRSADKSVRTVTRLCPVCDATMSTVIDAATRAAKVATMSCSECDSEYFLTETGLLPKE